MADKDVRYELDGQLFVWDSEKHESNKRKHGIAFEEAATVFMLDDTRYMPDNDNSDGEERFIAIGVSDKLNILMVCHCMRENDEVIRIISARQTEKHEQNLLKRRR